MTDLETLERVVEAVRLAHADIAPTYAEYYTLALGIAAGCGEAGRPYFHELCAYSAKYRAADAEKFFTYCLHHADGRVGMGSVVWLARQAGCDLPSCHLQQRPDGTAFAPQPDSSILSSKNAAFTPCARADNKVENEPSAQAEKPALPQLPHFAPYAWPAFLQHILDCGTTPSQRDAMLLATIGTLGATLGRMLYTFYGKKKNYATTQNFILGDPASGKGAVAWVKQLAMPIHEELLERYKAALKQYKHDRKVWDSLSYAQRKDLEEPKEPPLVLFLIPGNNSATGIKDNLITSGGTGLIFETEADTVGSAISADYGHWSDTMRKGHDHDEISFYRRTDHEYKQCPSTCFSIVMTGTPSQLKPIIPTCNDGQQSRTLFYWMPSIPGWADQFEGSETDYTTLFHTWGEQWKRVLDAVRRVASGFNLKLDETQKKQFNEHFAQIFGRAGVVHGGYMKSAVARLGLNLCRIMSVVALLRAWEELLPADATAEGRCAPADGRTLLRMMLQSPYIRPAGHVPAENVNDQVVSHFELSISEADFNAVLQLAEPLYLHSGRVADFLPDDAPQAKIRMNQESIFDDLPLEFSRTQALAAGARRGLTVKAVDSMIYRMLERGELVKTGRGIYKFNAAIRSTRAHGRKTGEENEENEESKKTGGL